MTGNPDVNFFIMPDYIANEYYAEISGLSDTLVDYYIEATDNKGNIFKTPIQHVYVGNYNPGGGGGGNPAVSWTPESPTQDDVITITITDPPTTGKLHWGVNNQGSAWETPDADYWPTGTVLFNGSGPAVETPFEGPNANNELTLSIGPFNNPVQEVYSIAFVIHYDDDSWDNNDGSDFHINLQGQGIVGVVWEPQNPNQYDSIKVFVGQVNVGANLHWGVTENNISWETPILSYWPTGSELFNGTGPAIETPFLGPDAESVLSIVLNPFKNPSQTVEGVNFVIHYNDNSWDNNNGSDYFIPVNNISTISLDLKVYLEGFYSAFGMTTILNTQGLIPLSQPYSVPPWNYQGTESVSAIPNVDVVDWVLVELRDTTTAALATGETVIARQAAFLLNDGKIVGLDGNGTCPIAMSITNNLFVVIYHRNHLAIMSANALQQIDGTFTYDFRDYNYKAYGLAAQKNLGAGSYGMISADADADGDVTDTDKTIWENQVGTQGYQSGDFDMDGQVNNPDKNDFWIPNYLEGSQVPD